MNGYIILADSGCDIENTVLKSWGVEQIYFTFSFDGKKELNNKNITAKKFYQELRNGKTATTSGINTERYKTFFKKYLKQNKDILYLAFSSGLSATVQSAKIAANELNAEYPKRKITVIDTLCASSGYGLLLYLCAQKKKEGADITEVCDFCEKIKLKINHRFTVDDLSALKRGGRISGTVALVGSMLGIKPLLCLDENGKIIYKNKTRGRKNAISALADKYAELADGGGDFPVFISHADCKEDAKKLKSLLFQKYGAKVMLINDIGAVIGAHCGGGTLALFFVGKSR